MKRLVLVLLLCASPANAGFMCAHNSVCSAYSSAYISLIFRGEAVEVTPQDLPPFPPGVAVAGRGIDAVRFVVHETLKGTPKQEITVTARAGSYEVGREYLVYAGKNSPSDIFAANSCVHQQYPDEKGNASDLQLLRALSKRDGSGAIFGRLYLGGWNLGGDFAPLENAEVMVSISGPVNREAQTEAHNLELDYILAGVPPGDYTVAAKGPTGTAATPVDKTGATVSVAPNSCSEVDWYLRVDSHIRGRVTDSSGQPVAGADVGMIQRRTREPELARGRFVPVTKLITDADGRYDFAGVNPGDYSVVLHHNLPRQNDPYPPVFYPAGVTPSDSQVLHLGYAQTLNGIDMVTPALLRPATVHLSVARANGTPIENATVIVTDPANTIEVAASERTDTNGRAVVQLFAGREYSITASTPDPNGQVQESPQCAGPVAFIATDGMDLATLVPDKTFKACRSTTPPVLSTGK